MINTKTKRNIVSLPEQFCNVLDNMVDNKMICNRTDALKQIILEQQKTHPDQIIFAPKSIPIPAWISRREWLNEKVMDEIVNIFKIADDASETHSAIAIDEIKTALKGWSSVGAEGLRELKKYRAANK